eukprot:310940-Pelagomonas_calceolata.AAC.1
MWKLSKKGVESAFGSWAKACIVSRGNSPSINQGRVDILAQKGHEPPPPHSRYRGLVGSGGLLDSSSDFGSTWLQNLAVRSIIVLARLASENEFVGMLHRYRLEWKLRARFPLVLKVSRQESALTRVCCKPQYLTATLYLEAPKACSLDTSTSRLSTHISQYPETDCGNAYTNARFPASISPSLKTSTETTNTSL